MKPKPLTFLILWLAVAAVFGELLDHASLAGGIFIIGCAAMLGVGLGIWNFCRMSGK